MDEPNNIFLYGNTGVGKTAVTDYLLDRLKADIAEYDDVYLSVISLNCKTLNSLKRSLPWIQSSPHHAAER